MDPAGFDVRVTDQLRLVERYVLAVFYYSANGPSWEDQKGFLQATPVCSWDGIECDALDSIVSIDFGTPARWDVLLVCSLVAVFVCRNL